MAQRDDGNGDDGSSNSRLSVRALVLIACAFLFWGTAQTVSLKWADRLAAPDRHAVVHTAAHTAASAAAHDGDVAAAAVRPATVSWQVVHNNNSSSSSTTTTTTTSTVVELTPEYTFAHPFAQVFFMFSAEALCLVVFAGLLLHRRYGSALASWWRRRTRRCCSKQESDGDEDEDGSAHKTAAALPPLRRGVDVSLPCNPCVWLLTSGADLLASVVQNIGMTLTTASMFQMLRGATVVWVALISHVWLHRRFVKVELWGIACVVVGLTLVGLSTLTRTHTDDDNDNNGDGHTSTSASEASLQTLGNVLVVSAQVMHAYQGVCQERLVHLYKVPPLQMVGIEGAYGVCLTLLLLALLQGVRTSMWGHNLVALRVRAVTTTTTVTYNNNNSNNSSSHARPVAPLVSLRHWTGGGDTAAASMRYTNVSWLLASAPLTGATPLAVPYDDMVLAFDQLSRATLCRIAVAVYIVSSFAYNTLQMYIIKYLSAAATVMIGSLRNVTVWAFCMLWPAVFAESFSAMQFAGFVFLMLGNALFQRVCFARFDDVLPRRLVDACPWLLRDGNSGSKP